VDKVQKKAMVCYKMEDLDVNVLAVKAVDDRVLEAVS
jgi:hypothetical protein